MKLRKNFFPKTKEKGTKYNAKSFVVNGITFDSKQEYKVYNKLKLLELSGEISMLRRATKIVRFRIIDKITYIQEQKLKTKVKYVERVDELAVHYKPDFVYYDNKENVYVCCEVKSRGTMLARDYGIRKKLMKHKIIKHNKDGKKQWVFREII